MPFTKDQFDEAARRLLGQDRYERLTGLGGMSRVDLCSEIAKEAFLGGLASADEPSLAVIKATAQRLWKGEGDLGLMS